MENLADRGSVRIGAKDDKGICRGVFGGRVIKKGYVSWGEGGR